MLTLAPQERWVLLWLECSFDDYFGCYQWLLFLELITLHKLVYNAFQNSRLF